MIYLKKVLVNDDMAIYMYGKEKSIYIGEVELNRNNFELPPKAYIYQDDQKIETDKMTYSVRQAIFGVLNLIKKNEFPDETFRATH